MYSEVMYHTVNVGGNSLDWVQLPSSLFLLLLRYNKKNNKIKNIIKKNTNWFTLPGHTACTIYIHGTNIYNIDIHFGCSLSHL